jgi:hypothetical protein
MTEMISRGRSQAQPRTSKKSTFTVAVKCTHYRCRPEILMAVTEAVKNRFADDLGMAERRVERTSQIIPDLAHRYGDQTANVLIVACI